jgi:hypothetical protein
MTKKRYILFLFVLISAVLFAAGNKDNESHQADNPSGFDDTLDTSERLTDKSKKYNFYLEAEDKGGNTVVEGPYNIFLDPESDLPIVSIINPREDMHMQGNLNIVGTSTDDDGVALVEVWFNDDENSKVRADGTDFWLLDYNTTNMPDNVYSISARGIDINGIVGNVKRVEWNLDRRKPEIIISSHESGALVNGRTTLEGSVWDGNGIESLEYSVDNGASYKPVKINRDRSTNRYNFDVAIDTKVFADGATVILFRSRDSLQSEGVMSFLLFVNNTPPEAEIVYPPLDTSVNGIFTAAGYAKHPMGIASLTWTLGKETGELPLVIGNPWWSKEFDIRGQNVKDLTLEIRAVDLSGNVTVTRRKLPVDQEADMPTITLSEPSLDSMFSESGLTVSGYAADDDGAEAVLYSMNGEAPVEIACSAAFEFVIAPPTVTGKDNTLEIWARDITGVEGKKTLVKNINNPGIAPKISLVSVSSGSGRTVQIEGEFYSGIEINCEAGKSLDVMIQSGSALQSITYQLGSHDPVQIVPRGSKGGEYIQNIPINPDSDYGTVPLQITAIDMYNRETSLTDYIFVPDLSTFPEIANHVSADRLRDGPLNLVGLNGLTSWQKQIVIAYGEKQPIPLTGLVAEGTQISKVTVNIADRPPINASVRNNEIQARLPPNLPLGLNTVTMTAAARTGETYTVSADVWVVRPSEGRQINIGESFTFLDLPESKVADNRTLLLTGQDVHGLYMFNGRRLEKVEMSGEGAESFSIRIDEHGFVRLSGRVKGSFGPLTLTLTNTEDQEFIYTGNFLVLDEEPNLSVRGPDNVWVQNSADITLQSRDAQWLQRLEYSVDQNNTWRQLIPQSELALLGEESPYTAAINLAGVADGGININIKAVDLAGHETIKTIPIHKDTIAPLANLVVPLVGASVNGTILLGMEIQEAGRIATVAYERPISSIEEDNEEEETDEAESPQSYSKQVYSASTNDLPLEFLDVLLDPIEMPLAQDMTFVFTDMAGNTSTLARWPFNIDEVMDQPVVQISLPIENEVITSDFVISGVSYDDDKVKYLHWRIDDEDEQIMEIQHSYTLPISLDRMTDNEHSVTMYVEDIYGVKGQPETRGFRISLSEPSGVVQGPGLGEILGGNVEIFGLANDHNGIKKVQVSLDNGISFNDADNITTPAEELSEEADVSAEVDDTTEVSTEGSSPDDEAVSTDGIFNWTYTLNTKILQDGPNVMFIKIWDEYDISAMYASMLVVDNTPPELNIDTPVDGISTNGILSIAGNSRDNIMLESMQIKLSSLEGVPIPEELSLREVPVNTLILDELDLSDLPGGSYNVELISTDKAQNITTLSRNIRLAQESQLNFVDILYPLNGEYLQGSFNVYGYIDGVDTAETVTLSFNGLHERTETITPTGFFRFAVNAEDLIPGTNTLVVKSTFGGKELVESSVRTIHYEAAGPWVTIDTMIMGDFAYERPWLRGRAAYLLTAEEESLLADKSTPREIKSAIETKKLEIVELSFDNGNTFVPVKITRGEYNWEYRIEDGDMREGIHYFMIRATMANGEKAITRFLVQVDKTPPVIRLFTPESGGRYNNELQFAALASDDNELKVLNYYLRDGDKSAYEVPAFLQGLYLEAVIPPFLKVAFNELPVMPFGGGATFMDFGFGLSFFDDNVKIQGNYGFLTQALYEDMGGEGPVRYGGNVLGLKLLANIYTLPFASFAGPDWEWLSASFALGANFSLFDVSREGYTQSGVPTWMSALLLQVEFPKVTLPKRNFLRTFSLFTEGQLWFVPTDVNAEELGIETILPKIVMGLRLYIF